MAGIFGHAKDHSLRIMIPENVNTNQSSSCSDDETNVGSSSTLRQYKSYTVMQKSGFQHTEYVQILTNLCKAEVFVSLLYLVHGISCPGYPEGLFTGGLGLGAVHRFRWRTILVMWLVFCIISAVANLLSVICAGVWLDHLSKLKTRTGLANGLSGMMLLGSVLIGVCFILTSVILCHYWASNSTKYQAVGKIAKRSRYPLRRRPSKPGSGSERQKFAYSPGSRSCNLSPVGQMPQVEEI